MLRSLRRTAPCRRSRASRIIPEHLSASQAASKEQRLEAERDQKDDEALDSAELRWRVAKAANDTAAANAALEAWRASKAVVSAKLPEEKKQLRGKRDQRERAANTARCRCQSTCVLGGVESCFD